LRPQPRSLRKRQDSDCQSGVLPPKYTHGMPPVQDDSINGITSE
jgi:hypothetical protein